MTAAYFDAYGGCDVIKTGLIPTPSLGVDEVRVAVHAAGMNPRDVRLRQGFFKWIAPRKFPKVTGSDFSGTVMEVGHGVTNVSVGQQVFGYIQNFSTGSAAEQLVVKASWVAVKPEGLGHDTAAALPCAYLTALQALRDRAAVRPNQRVLVYGASGGVGTAALQLARHFGAHTTAVTSEKNSAYCVAQGADRVLHYDKQDIWAEDGPYDVFFQVHSPRSFYTKASKLLKRRGIFVSLIPAPSDFIRGFLLKLTRAPQLIPMLVRVTRADLEEVTRLTVAGVLRPEVSVMPLRQAKQAHLQLESGHTRGKVVLSIVSDK